MEHADVAYLASKRTVDERARNQQVRDRLLEALPGEPTVVDAGTGIGSMAGALRAWGVTPAVYLGVDRARALLVHARDTAQPAAGPDRTGFAVGDVRALPAAGVDLVVAQALLDVVPIGPAMAEIERALRPGGLAYLPITFAGVTRFEPAHPDDGAVLAAYHAAIDARPGRDSRAGRTLRTHLDERDGDLLAAGASDWVVRPQDGGYPDAEARFVATILDFVEAAVARADVDATDWLDTRRDQLAGAQLRYAAENVDLLYRAP